jgi:hypothetical protein
MYLAMVTGNRIDNDDDDDNDRIQQRHQQHLYMKNAMIKTLIVYFYMSVLIARLFTRISCEEICQ